MPSEGRPTCAFRSSVKTFGYSVYDLSGGGTFFSLIPPVSFRKLFGPFQSSAIHMEFFQLSKAKILEFLEFFQIFRNFQEFSKFLEFLDF